MYRRLLVPLDGSHLAEAVLPVAERLAVVWNAMVVLLHITERGAPSTVHGEPHLRSVIDADPYLNRVAEDLLNRGIAVETHVHEVPEGDVARSIAEHGAEVGSDITILCTHGRGSVRDLLFGRIAQQVLQHGSQPVLLVRPREGTPLPFDPSVVLVPLDGSRGSERALPVAADFASSLGAELLIVTVVPTQETLRGDRQAVGTLLPSATRAALDVERATAEHYLNTTIARVHQDHPALPVSVNLLRGDVSSALAAETTDRGAGLVVLATHGRAGLRALWSSSVTSQLLGRTRSPVLLLRAPTEQDEEGGTF